MISFSVRADTDSHLATGTAETDAMITVQAREDGTAGSRSPDYAEVIIIDCSGSMATPRSKLDAARQAACAAVDSLRPGTLFAVIRGSSIARTVYPPEGGLVRATEQTRADARRLVQQVEAGGGTAIGRWLLAARDLFAEHPDAFRHAILLTDGKNEHETAAAFRAALAACQGRFQCDSRGVGRGWVAAELTAVSDALLGSARDVADPADLVEDFQRMTVAAMARARPEISLRVWVPRHARISLFKQVTPTISDLLDHARPVGALESEFPTGAWRAERRTYHLTISDLRPRTSTEPCRLARVAVVSGDEVLASNDVKAVWTSEPTLYSRRSRQAEYSRATILLETAFTRGTEALRRGDSGNAADHLSRARGLAYDLGDDTKIEMLDQLLQPDPVTGRVRIRPGIDPHDLEVFDVRSRYTRPARPREPAPGAGAGPGAGAVTRRPRSRAGLPPAERLVHRPGAVAARRADRTPRPRGAAGRDHPPSGRRHLRRTHRAA
ncbi:von Willebrand factor type A domain-containing protein [Frankia sp. EI5c]|uniref:VWA domain-containing protein n=1 Tax=Frankia sp. EI5c TaxID=683316 RepID=UPI0007C21606|nr:vWA domain-containing protein [Frankia sp. EI5c]OAA23991.1 von Willebrand factor type A domain-containing protein [Frankia sp. EI5c]